nr:hypothetical protein BaRGS_025757 [Batillaria attramentaria]
MAQKLTLEQRKEYARVFVELDSDGNGWLSREEVGIWLRNSGYNLSDQEKEKIKKLIANLDKDGDGQISYTEFIRAFRA